MRSVLPLILLTAAVAGCATHRQMGEPVRLSRTGVIEDPSQAAAVEKAATDAPDGKLLDAREPVRMPTRLAVADLSMVGRRAGLRPLGAEEVAEWQKVVAGLAPITGVQAIPSVAVSGSGLKLYDLRRAAAQRGCGLLLVYLQSDTEIDNYNNAALLYWTFVGLWLAPGNTYEHRTVMQAVLVDTRTGTVLGTATGDCHLKEACAAANDRAVEQKLAQEAPRRAQADLQKGCQALLKQVVAAAQKSAPAAEPPAPAVVEQPAPPAAPGAGSTP
jgi:hypothetical protein